MKLVHKSKKKIHYRAIVKPEKCVICGEDFPNLHNHYRAHLLNQCQGCLKYFTSYKVISAHVCGKEDSDPSKVFTSDANVNELINTYVPKDEKDDEKYYGHTDDEDEDVEPQILVEESQEEESQDCKDIPMLPSPIISDVLSLFKTEMNGLGEVDAMDDVVDITDDDSVGVADSVMPIVIIDDD